MESMLTVEQYVFGLWALLTVGAFCLFLALAGLGVRVFTVFGRRWRR